LKIRDLLKDHQRKLFVGREQELALIHRTTSRYQEDWKWIHFYGQGGIGKTSLLRSFATVANETYPIYFEGFSGFQQPLDFLRLLRRSIDPNRHYNSDRVWNLEEAIEHLNQFAILHNGTTLLFDTFEQWGNIEDWLLEEWLPALNPSIKICSAGRFPLSSKWRRSGFIHMSQNIELHPLSEVEVKKYVGICGFDESLLARSLYQFSKGVPLALSLACEIIAQGGRTSFLNNLQQKEVIGHLMEELIRDLTYSVYQTYLEATALVWRFDQELLQALLKEEVPTNRFLEFCRLPFIIRHDRSWMLHDSVRQWIYTDLRDRKPQVVETYRLRALDTLRDREKKQPDLKVELSVDKIYLCENDFVRNFSFRQDHNIRIRGCYEEDIELCVQQYLNYLQHQSNYIADEVHLENLIRPLWNAAPESFITLWNHDQMIAFCTCVPLRESTIQIFRQNPITAPVTSLYIPNKIQYLITVAGVDPNIESEINGTILRALSTLINREGEIINLLSSPNWLPFLPLLGYERIEQADTRTEKGVIYEAYRLDQNSENFTSKVDRLFSPIEATEPMQLQQNERSTPSLDEVFLHLKRVLKNYHQLHDNSLLPSLQFLEPSNDQYITQVPLSLKVQQKIESALISIVSGNNDERLLSSIIQSAYIRRTGPHELLAERYNLSSPTYYRYLRKGIEKLAYELLKK